ncbi:MAG: phosphoribosylformylglycinamidine synthase subunit PurQ [Anaerolineaceae bacterium]
MKPKALVLQAHGSNRDFDVIEALTLAGAQAAGVPLNELKSRKSLLAEYQLLVIPGGFSYADALGAGKLLALDLASYFAEEISAFVDSGKPVIGICNGFQALVKSGILPSTRERVAGGAGATLTFNEQGHFECRWVTLKPLSKTCIWTSGLEEFIDCPVAHGEGNFQVASRFSAGGFYRPGSNRPGLCPSRRRVGQWRILPSTPTAPSTTSPGFATRAAMYWA